MATLLSIHIYAILLQRAATCLITDKALVLRIESSSQFLADIEESERAPRG